MKLSELPAYAKIAADKDLSAADLEELIVKLMTLRSQTEPPVHSAPPSEKDAHLRSTVAVQNDADVTFAALANGGVRLWFRHNGLGWFVVQYSAEKARLFRDYLIKWVPGEAPVNLINDQSTGGSRLQ